MKRIKSCFLLFSYALMTCGNMTDSWNGACVCLLLRPVLMVFCIVLQAGGGKICGSLVLWAARWVTSAVRLCDACCQPKSTNGKTYRETWISYNETLGYFDKYKQRCAANYRSQLLSTELIVTCIYYVWGHYEIYHFHYLSINTDRLSTIQCIVT